MYALAVGTRNRLVKTEQLCPNGRTSPSIRYANGARRCVVLLRDSLCPVTITASAAELASGFPGSFGLTPFHRPRLSLAAIHPGKQQHGVKVTWRIFRHSFMYCSIPPIMRGAVDLLVVASSIKTVLDGTLPRSHLSLTALRDRQPGGHRGGTTRSTPVPHTVPAKP